ncbi:hypothetical protein [Enterobacter sp.]|uniref:hypothetical protein n=1 Tax=Enterobacter sp. TaxID=42895 RepID=UPI00296F792D|nr:hypothetical protein [Enterobacter sp.]
MIYKDFYSYLLERFSQPVDLFTGARKQPFTLYSEQGVLFIINAKNNIRRLGREGVDAFIARFEETGSVLPGDYQDVTFNASYLLAVMKYLSRNEEGSTTVVRFHHQENANSEKHYHLWLQTHPQGFVLNLLKSNQGKEGISVSNSTCLHAAGCHFVNNDRSYSQPLPYTGGDYFKICADNFQELENEALRITRLTKIKRCRCLKNTL